MRRPLLRLAALFAAGCLAGSDAGLAEIRVLLVLAAALLCLAALGRRVSAARAAIAAAAVALGATATGVEALSFEARPLRRAAAAADPVAAADAAMVRLTGSLRSEPLVRDGRLAAVLEVESVEEAGRRMPTTGTVRVDIGGRTPQPPLHEGERVAIWVRLRSSGAEGVRDDVEAHGYCKSGRLVEVLPARPSGLVRAAVQRVRTWAHRALVDSIAPGPERGLVLAMVLGDRSEIDSATADAFRASGTYHVLALSGAQVALVAGLAALCLRRLVMGPWLQAGLTSALVVFYSLLVGADVPVVRAALMSCAVLVGRALELDGDAGNLLGLAALALLAWHPSCVADIGFVLSFGATLGILLLTGPLVSGLPRLPLRLETGVAASVAAQAALSPVLAGAFHRLAPAAVVLNLLAVPLSSAVLLAGLAVLPARALGAGRLLGLVAWGAARLLRASGDLGPLAPWLDIRVPGPSAGILALYACGIALLARGRRGGGLALLALAHAGLLFGPFQPWADGRFHLKVIDVGQGDSLLLLSPRGRAILVDAGGGFQARADAGERRVAPELWQDGVRRLDALVLTHAQPDHVGGAPFVLRAFDTAEIWEGPAPVADPIWRRFSAALPRGPARRAVASGQRLLWEGADVAVLGPAPPGPPPRRVRNEESLVLGVRFGAVHFLLSGDVTGPAERTLSVPLSAVVKVPHHGSRSSSSTAFVAAARPRLALVSAGARNPFGHPHPEVLERYLAAGALVLRTDRDGTVDVATDGRRVWARTSEEGEFRRIQ